MKVDIMIRRAGKEDVQVGMEGVIHNLCVYLQINNLYITIFFKLDKRRRA